MILSWSGSGIKKGEHSMLTLTEEWALEARRERGRADVVTRRGAEWLDRVQPDWAQRVDPTLLNIGSSNYCVFAQVEGVPWELSTLHDWLLAEVEVNWGNVRRTFEQYGFIHTIGTCLLQTLNKAWCDRIKERCS
jgi:hypothetical protein